MASRPLFARLTITDGSALTNLDSIGATLGASLTSDQRMRTAWPSEIALCGDGGWRSHEELLVELKIEAAPFADYIACWRPNLYVCQDDAIIGHLSLVEAPDAPEQQQLEGQ